MAAESKSCRRNQGNFGNYINRALFLTLINLVSGGGIMMKATINKETISSSLFLICALTFLSIYGGMMAFSPYGPFSIGMIIIIASAIIGFLITCALSAYGCPERKPFYVGFFFGLVPAHVISLFLGAAVLGFLLENTNFFSYIPVWGVCILIGSTFWGLVAIPICAIFRWIFAQRQKG